MSKVERHAVLFTAPGMSEHVREALVIDDQFALTFETEGDTETWTFRSLVDGQSAVDLATCRRYEIEAEPVSDSELAELLETNLIEVVKKFAK